MSMPRDKYITVNGNKIRYWQEGARGANVLLVHGIAASCEYWMYNIFELAKHFRVYAVDMLGFGKSDNPDIDFTVQNFAAFLKAFLQQQGVDKVVLVGHSLGGMICLRFAIDYPLLLEKLVLVDSAGFGQDIPFSFRILTIPFLGSFLLKFDEKHLVAKALRAYCHNRVAITDEFIGLMCQILKIPGNKKTMIKILRRHANIMGVKSSSIGDILTGLAKVKTPTLLLWGRQDRLLPPKHAQIALSKLPNAKLHIFDHCGHVPQMEVKDEFNALLIECLSVRS